MEEESATEAILQATRDLDQMAAEEVLGLIHSEDAVAHAAVGRTLPEIVQAVDVLVCVIAGGGRWFNLGAGTSGRMGVLDASEIPPTFGMSVRCVQGLIAGGERALRESIEGAEDDPESGAWELRERGFQLGDALVAISASGRTPYTLGGVELSAELGARSIAITCDGDSPLARAAEIAIVPQVGPEVIAGSTRMKGGLAQKMVLHMLSTAVMVQLGRVEGNRMTNLNPLSQKLRRRAVGIVSSLANLETERAGQLLDAHDGDVSAALRSARAKAREG